MTQSNSLSSQRSLRSPPCLPANPKAQSKTAQLEKLRICLKNSTDRIVVDLVLRTAVASLVLSLVHVAVCLRRIAIPNHLHGRHALEQGGAQMAVFAEELRELDTALLQLDVQARAKRADYLLDLTENKPGILAQVSGNIACWHKKLWILKVKFFFTF